MADTADIRSNRLLSVSYIVTYLPADPLYDPSAALSQIAVIAASVHALLRIVTQRAIKNGAIIMRLIISASLALAESRDRSVACAPGRYIAAAYARVSGDVS